MSHWDGLCRFLDDGRIEIDSNTVCQSAPNIDPRSRSIARTRSSRAATRAAPTGRVIASLIETCKLNGVNPHAWLAETLTKLVNGWPQSRIDDLMPWAYAKIPA